MSRRKNIGNGCTKKPHKPARVLESKKRAKCKLSVGILKKMAHIVIDMSRYVSTAVTGLGIFLCS